MIIKTEIEMVTGFLSSGKTAFINALLRNSLVSEEVVIIIQCEMGNTQIKRIEKYKSKVIIKQMDRSKEITDSLIKQLIDFYKPHRIIIECNGTKRLDDLLIIFNAKSLEQNCREPIVYHLSEAATFNVFHQNMKELIEPNIINSHLIMINNCSSISKEERKSILKKIQELNKAAIILTNENLKELQEVLEKAEVMESEIIKRVFVRIKNRQANKAVRGR